ncbi:hypothetical protein WOLCODRAFT_87174 [Wolfiporia cocos MD-104 SS10]|uniref:Zn(2)-C6 fungal-type domain-containing protein n=1 Tax=Wolfiporia cocos (strain MD-104) TaxID=742152 RepID=A0A2H3IX31_WOLCO|nr:hypothetical protein WOLCODRAFT_87174 [Wolfiporia cocos MD-104 SS10]
MNISDDDPDPGPSTLKGIKRGSRACDRCRKLKSKCEPTSSDRCKNCVAAGAPCTFQGPSFKRGPPKGYIHAIEQRWHQVECILASIIAAPQAQGIVQELRGDAFARAILDRVESGPYGPSGRLRQPQAPTSESFYATIMGSPGASRDDRRVRRQSRMTREIVSIEDSNILATPTREWQEQLISRLSGQPVHDYPASPPAAAASVSPGSHSSSSFPGQQQPEPARRRRRLEGTFVPGNAMMHGHWSGHHAASDGSYSNMDEVDDAVDSFGHLALDDHKEIRYHGHASGLPLLARSECEEGVTNTDGIWFEDQADMPLPPIDVQNHLVSLYFTYVHPFFPVIHKQHFLENFPLMDPRIYSGSQSAPERMPLQTVDDLLLLSMFALAARYWDGESQGARQMFDEGVIYAVGARTILNKIYQFSRPSTVQALLLLGIREFGIGSMEQGWLYSGMALRMAIDLGLNRNADNWTTGGQELFNSVEKQIRKQIWWSCCITDKLSAMWMGRPITFRANDHTTLKPEIIEDEYENWQPFPPNALGPDFTPMPSLIMTCYRAQCELSVIITDIMDQIYPVQSHSGTPRRTLLQQLEQRLHSWLINLPDQLRYSTTSSIVTPLPHVLLLHIEYCTAVLLLHRALPDSLPLKSFDICQSAAAHISSIVTVFDEKYGLSRCPPFLSIYLQSAGIMHVITLARRPQNPQASIRLEQCITALEHMAHIWPSSTRVRTLLQGANVKKDQLSLTMQNQQELRQKRSVEEALGAERNSDILNRETLNRPSYPGAEMAPPGQALNNDLTTRMMLHPLGLGTPGMDPSSSYYPGYQWWPRTNVDEGLLHNDLMGVPVMSPSSEVMHPAGAGIPEATFSFNQQHLSPDFVQGVHYPILDPNNLFPPPPPDQRH